MELILTDSCKFLHLYKSMCSTFSKITQSFDFIKPKVIRKLVHKVQYITQTNGGLIIFFQKFEKNIF